MAGAIAVARRHFAVERLEAVDELVPEPSVCPVLDREGGTERDREVLRAIDLVKLVAKVERRLRAVAPLAEVAKLETDARANVAEPLKVSRAVAVDAPLDAADG
eukprot:6207912-Pleurochrysis_carterae.AAC.1